mmetsp:Transcript_8193/g.9088  ORF Transcript_8193/g.9088 Transcript_8193/m.9088 type:complete len:630 (-) Transcript_8193:52-1941(-)
MKNFQQRSAPFKEGGKTKFAKTPQNSLHRNGMASSPSLGRPPREKYLDMKAGSRRMSFDPTAIHVLVIDDEAVSRHVVKRTLNDCGYQHVDVCESCEEALKLLRPNGDATKSSYNMIISDVKMPGMDGIDLLRTLQADEVLRRLPVVMISAVEDVRLVYQCVKLGATDFILKPVRRAQLQNLWSSVYKKQREKLIMSQFDENQRDKQKMQDKLAELTEEVQVLTEAPITAITRAINDLLSKEGTLSPDVKQTLNMVILNLKNLSGLYTPAFEDKGTGQARLWIQNELNLTKPSDTPTVTRRKKLRKSLDWSRAIDSTATEALRAWSFDVWSYDVKQLLPLMYNMFADFDLMNTFKIDPEDFKGFLNAVSLKYHKENPYHNFIHAFDVTHTVYLTLTKTRVSKFLSPLDVFAVLLSSLVHDIDHPGESNVFHVNSRSQLALRYNDNSVLENYHASAAFEMMSEYNILSNLSQKDYRYIRAMIIEAILATDLKFHMELLTKFKETFLNGEPNVEALTRDHRALLIKIILKSADLSNPSKPFPIARYWANMIQEEFFLQGDKEKKLGLDYSPFCDRATSDLFKMQVNFIDFIVHPLFESVYKFLPKFLAYRQLVENKARWNQLIKERDNAGT